MRKVLAALAVIAAMSPLLASSASARTVHHHRHHHRHHMAHHVHHHVVHHHVHHHR